MRSLSLICVDLLKLTSVLLMPGPQQIERGEFPMVPGLTAVSVLLSTGSKSELSNNCSRDNSLEGGHKVRFTRRLEVKGAVQQLIVRLRRYANRETALQTLD